LISGKIPLYINPGDDTVQDTNPAPLSYTANGYQQSSQYVFSQPGTYTSTLGKFPDGTSQTALFTENLSQCIGDQWGGSPDWAAGNTWNGTGWGQSGGWTGVCNRQYNQDNWGVNPYYNHIDTPPMVNANSGTLSLAPPLQGPSCYIASSPYPAC